MKTFSKFEIANLKRTAQSVYPLVKRREKLIREIEDRQLELDSIENQIEGYQYPITKMTGGYTTDDLVTRSVVDTGKKDKEGNPIKITKYDLKYPETIVPANREVVLSGKEVIENIYDAPMETPFPEAPIDEPFNI